MTFSFSHGYNFQQAYTRCVAYFSMEYGIHQPLKTYAGGLGFLAGSHMRSAYELQQNMIGIGIKWKYGYYDQVRKQDQTMDVLFEEKNYGFLRETGIRFTIKVAGHDVWVTAWYLAPEIFLTAPLFLLSTDLPENDYLARTISHRLYDANPETALAAAILLGAGGARLLELLEIEPDVYHLNESHGLPLAFYLYTKYRNLPTLKEKLVFTNHTPEAAGNQKTALSLLGKMGFFFDMSVSELRSVTAENSDELNHTLTALRMAGIGSGVSKKHLATMQKNWGAEKGICPLISITNAQDFGYWHDKELYELLNSGDVTAFAEQKRKNKLELFEIVADQAGEIYDDKICTIIFAKRFVNYKRPDLLLRNMERFHRLVTNPELPVQIIWAGKPYPMDYASIGIYDRLVNTCRRYSNCSVLSGYELRLSKTLKKAADIWLNTPRLPHEASGTSGMSAAMNGAVNVSTADGWFPEFARDKINAYIIPAAQSWLTEDQQDENDATALYDLLETEVIPAYYSNSGKWMQLVSNSMRDIIPYFDSKRMAAEYYQKLYVPQ